MSKPLSLEAVRRAMAGSAAPENDAPGAIRDRMVRRTADGRRLPLPSPPAGNPPAPAAVVVPFTLRDSELHVVMTKRAEDLNHHGGQISFPGGGVEPGDATYLEAALREFREELGVLPDHREVLGALDPVYVPVSRFMIYPYAVYIGSRPRFAPSPAEVALVIDIPLKFFMDPANLEYRPREVPGKVLSRITPVSDGPLPHRITVLEPGFDFQGHWIWGASAFIIDQVVRRIEGAVP